MKIPYIVYTILFFINLKTQSSKKDEPVRLEKEAVLKKPRKKRFQTLKKIYPWIVLGVGLTILLLVTVIVVYKTGCLESTNYYYRM